MMSAFVGFEMARMLDGGANTAYKLGSCVKLHKHTAEQADKVRSLITHAP